MKTVAHLFVSIMVLMSVTLTIQKSEQWSQDPECRDNVSVWQPECTAEDSREPLGNICHYTQTPDNTCERTIHCQRPGDTWKPMDACKAACWAEIRPYFWWWQHRGYRYGRYVNFTVNVFGINDEVYNSWEGTFQSTDDYMISVRNIEKEDLRRLKKFTVKVYFDKCETKITDDRPWWSRWS